MPTVIGAIKDRWDQLGGPGSYLRNPVTDELDFDGQGGRYSAFEGGSIFWWPDVGAVDMGEMFVHYTGLACFKETSGPGSDEPYAVFGVTSPNREPLTFRTQIFGDVDAGGSRPDLIQLYQGLPAGLVITYALMEHDQGDPENYKAAMQGVAGAVTAAAAGAVKFIPKVGPILSLALGPLGGLLNPIIADGLGTLLGLGDDRIGAGAITLTPKDMVQMAIRPNANERGVNFKFTSPNLTEDGGNYKLYFGGVKTP